MAFLAGIGRALTSIGSDMQRNRLAREKREEFFADRTNTRVHAEKIREQQAQIRADETQANRDHARRQQATQNLYTAGQTKRTREYNEGVVAAQNKVRSDAAAEAARLADDRQLRGWEHTDELWEDATTAARNLNTRGRPLSEITVAALPGTGAVYSPGGSPEEDWMTLARVGVTSLPGGERQPSAGQASAVRRNVAAAGEIVHPEEGWVTGFQYSPYEIEQRSQAILRGEDPGGWNQGVPEPAFEPELIDTPGWPGRIQRTLPWGKTGSEISTPPDLPPQIDPDMLRYFQEQGMSQEDIDNWIARQVPLPQQRVRGRR